MKAKSSKWMGWSAASGMAIAGLAPAGVVHRICVLMGQQEVPANGSQAIGGGFFRIDTDTNTVAYRIVVADLSPVETAAHIHGPAAPGVNAGVLTPLPVGPIKAGVWTYPEALEAALLDGRMYVNVHTTAFPGGEVRGQIVTHVAMLDGGQEVPANASTARGFGLFVQDTCANTLNYYIAFAGLSAAQTAAHIHGVANYGTNASVVFPLAVGSPISGVWGYAEAQEQNLIDGLMYVNVHTTAFPGGEIRGQIISALQPMDGQQEVPANGTGAVGIGMVAIHRAANAMGYDVRRTTFGTGETAAHIHGFSGPGANSGVQTPIAPVPSQRKLGVWTYGAANGPAVLGGRTYFNVHTAAFPGGEIRGQIANFGQPTVRCIADVDDGSGTGTPDCGVTIDDLLYYLGLFEAGAIAADVDDGSGTGTPDGGVTIDDLLYYLVRFEGGC